MHGAAVVPKLDIVDTLIDEVSFRVLIGALQTAGLVDELKGAGPFTFFAPTDQAFETLPTGAVTELEKPENHGRLRRLLQHHVVPDRHLASAVKTYQSLTTICGSTLAIESDGSGLKVERSPVLSYDILCTNGVIHVVGAVLAPK
jgi:uncharacterized surface protein with fasciclin (FAS1) repeats